MGSSLPTRGKMAGDEAGVTLGQPHLSRQDLGTLVSAARGAPSSEIGLPELGGGAPGAEGAGVWARGAARGAVSLLPGPTAADACHEGAGGGGARGAELSTLGGRGPRAEGRGPRAEGRAAARGAGPAGPGGCQAPGRGASPPGEREAPRLRVPPAPLKLLWLTGGCSFPRVRVALFCRIKDFSLSEIES